MTPVDDHTYIVHFISPLDCARLKQIFTRFTADGYEMPTWLLVLCAYGYTHNELRSLERHFGDRL